MARSYVSHVAAMGNGHTMSLPGSATVVACSKTAASADAQSNVTSGVTTANAVRVWFDGASALTKIALRINGAAAPTISAVASTPQVGTWAVVGAAGVTVMFICEGTDYITGVSFRPTAGVGNVYCEFFSI